MALTEKIERIPGRGPHVDKDGWLPAWFINILNDLLDVYYQNDDELMTTKQDTSDVLTDLATLGPATADGEFLVATGAGVFAYEADATARTSMGAQTQGDVLDDLNTLGAPTTADQFPVSTGAGVFAYQSGPATSDGTTGGLGSAGAGNQYLEITVGGTTYRVLHDGTV